MSSSDRKNRSSPADVARAEANDPRIEPIFPSASFEVSEDVSVSKWNSPTPAFHEDEADDMELNEVDRATERCDTIPDAKSQSSSGSRSSRNGSRQMTMTEDCFEGNDPNDSDDDQVASGPSTLTFGTASENISRHVQHTAAAGDDCDDEAMSRTTLSDFDDTESPYASYGEDMILSGSSSPSSIRSTQKSQYSSPSFAEEEEVAARRGVQLRSTFRKLLRDINERICEFGEFINVLAEHLEFSKASTMEELYREVFKELDEADSCEFLFLESFPQTKAVGDYRLFCFLDQLDEAITTGASEYEDFLYDPLVIHRDVFRTKGFLDAVRIRLKSARTQFQNGVAEFHDIWFQICDRFESQNQTGSSRESSPSYYPPSPGYIPSSPSYYPPSPSQYDTSEPANSSVTTNPQSHYTLPSPHLGSSTLAAREVPNMAAGLQMSSTASSPSYFPPSPSYVPSSPTWPPSSLIQPENDETPASPYDFNSRLLCTPYAGPTSSTISPLTHEASEPPTIYPQPSINEDHSLISTPDISTLTPSRRLLAPLPRSRSVAIQTNSLNGSHHRSNSSPPSLTPKVSQNLPVVTKQQGPGSLKRSAEDDEGDEDSQEIKKTCTMLDAFEDSTEEVKRMEETVPVSTKRRAEDSEKIGEHKNKRIREERVERQLRPKTMMARRR